MVFELKSDFCQGFQIISKDKFLFIDSRKIVTKLERKKETRALEEICEINLKEKDSQYFVLDNKYRDTITMEKYLIYKSKVFYLFQDEPLSTGILDMEELADFEDYEDDNDEI